MPSQAGFSCFVIGSDSLLIECAGMLLGRGHDVRGVIAGTPRIAQFAAARGLQAIDPGAGYLEALSREPFDYLFSITHLEIIAGEVLALPRRGAINFHDGPLPKYAGLNAPGWALLHGEKTYGVTWHRIAKAVDSGDILKQVTFDVSADETSLSLNTKCFAHAIETFAELIDELSSDTAVGRAQELVEGSYFGRWRRPEAASVIDWNGDASSIERMVRALYVGDRHENSLGLPKVYAGESSFIVTRAEARPASEMSPPPSTVTEVSEDAIAVATADGVLVIREAVSLTGHPLALSDLAGQLRLEPGSRFENLDRETRQRLTALDERAARSELFWAQRLASAAPMPIPYGRPIDGLPEEHAEVSLDLTPAAREQLGGIEGLLAAFAIYCTRIARQDDSAPAGELPEEWKSFTIGLADASSADAGAISSCFAPLVPVSIAVDYEASFETHRRAARAELDEIHAHGPYLRDLVARHPRLGGDPRLADGSAWPVCVAVDVPPPPVHRMALVVSTGGAPRLSYDPRTVSAAHALAMARNISAFLDSAARDPAGAVGAIPIMSEEERARVLGDPNRTERSYRAECLHRLFEEQVEKTPDARAIVFQGVELSYRQLNERANRLGAHLQSLGVGPEVLVGIYLERSLDLVVAVLATAKAGGAYLPLDPQYPSERIRFMLGDSKVRVVVSDGGEGPMAGAPPDVRIVRLGADADVIQRCSAENLAGGATPENLAYVIYTSGSTGAPKGVMIEHRNVANFFAGMNDRIAHDRPGTWLAVTSLSFDISVLELFWPLTHGFTVVLHRDRTREAGSIAMPSVRRSVQMSLFYFASDESAGGKDKYELLLEGAKFADRHGFAAVWTPERHFHAFGGLYPNPAVTGAALAVSTQNVQIRAGSVVLPLHHPAEVVEAWSVVDNLSRGRVGISFASGWQPNDFVLRPENFKDNKKVLLRDLETVKALWRGEAVVFAGPKGDAVSIRTLPRPVQKELPVWITTAGNIETYQMAGQIGANVLTHLLGQSAADLAPKIAAYRTARGANGHEPDGGVVSLMLHTFVGDDESYVRAAVREPLQRYLGSSLELLKHYAWAFPAFSRPKEMSGDFGDDLARLSDEERDAILEHACARYYETSGLFGKPDQCLRMIDDLAAIGVDEIACLVDFGVPAPRVLAHLVDLARVRAIAAGADRSAPSEDHSAAVLMRRHRITHLQCTPSMARMFLDQPEVRARLNDLECWMVGGEALGQDLARDLRAATSAGLLNMYGPTETTVWSTTHQVGEDVGPVPIGTAIANTKVYVLDSCREPVPFGAVGELYIGGDGVARGYLGREELTTERFLVDPFAAGGRMYRTGDRVTLREDGVLEFHGRRDQQIKIRGHRVESEEVEAAISREEGVARCVVVLREDVPGDQRLVAYVVPRSAALDESGLRESLKTRLPEFMVPAHVVLLSALPETPNRKVDRRALPPPRGADARAASYVAPSNDVERRLAAVWQELLGKDRIGTDDNFFDVGGHSLLIVRMHRKVCELIDQPITLTDLYRFPTIRSLSDFLTRTGPSAASDEGAERAERRREMSRHRRRISHV